MPARAHEDLRHGRALRVRYQRPPSGLAGKERHLTPVQQLAGAAVQSVGADDDTIFGQALDVGAHMDLGPTGGGRIGQKLDQARTMDQREACTGPVVGEVQPGDNPARRIA